MKKRLFLICLLNLICKSILAQIPTYKVGTDPYFEPYTFKDETGITGFNKDILTAIGEDQGFNIQMIEGEWPKIFDFLRDGRVDMVMSWVVQGNPITTGFLDSHPYLFIPKSGIGYVNEYLPINGVNSLRGFRIGVNIKSSDEAYLRENGVNNLKEGKTLFELFRWTGQGLIDGFIGDRLVLEYMAKKFANRKHNNRNIQLQVKPLYPEDEENNYQPLIVFFRPHDLTLANKFNLGLSNIKESGKYQEIIHKWFGENALVR